MSQNRRKFSPQFKAEAVQFVIESDRPVAEIAREWGVLKKLDRVRQVANQRFDAHIQGRSTVR